MTGTRPSVWIVLLNWNGLDDTLACLESLAAADLSLAESHTLVVDNGSREDPRRAIHDRFPSVETVRMDRNLGFVGGCNYGLAQSRRADADYVLLLNNDTVVDPGFLGPLLTYAEEHPEAGLVGPLICIGDHPDHVSSAGGRVDLTFGLVRIPDFGQPRSRVPLRPRAVEFLTGCCLLVPRRVTAEVGMFDEDFFAYYDDVDYCRRVQRAGFTLVCVPESVIWHRESSSTRREVTDGLQSPLKHYLMVRNRIAIVRQHGTRRQAAVFFLLVVPGMAAYYSIGFVVRRRWEKMRWFWRGLLDGLRNRLGAPPLDTEERAPAKRVTGTNP